MPQVSKLVGFNLFAQRAERMRNPTGPFVEPSSLTSGAIQAQIDRVVLLSTPVRDTDLGNLSTVRTLFPCHNFTATTNNRHGDTPINGSEPAARQTSSCRWDRVGGSRMWPADGAACTCIVGQGLSSAHTGGRPAPVSLFSSTTIYNE